MRFKSTSLLLTLTIWCLIQAIFLPTLLAQRSEDNKPVQKKSERDAPTALGDKSGPDEQKQAKPESSDESNSGDTSGEEKVSSVGIDASGGKPNRLATESSPYLLQHARNPVDWYPWGLEAFDKAKRENKLVFLSVGYAACHWCHVMERESFEDEKIADFLNDRFVCVKVDREERPDVDQIYMTAVQLVSGHGGWPMSVFLLPDGKPFWGGTYFPARDGDRGNATGFMTVISQIDQAWKQQRQQVVSQAEAVTRAIREQQLTTVDLDANAKFDEALIEMSVEALRGQYDLKHGGFASSENGPKFPEASNLWLLQSLATEELSQESPSPSQPTELPRSDTSAKSKRLSASLMLQGTLDGMIRGGMYDHLGGGFHRYSVDGEWLIPHFEKMLYDNAQLASVFANASSLFGNEEYQRIAEGICDFMLREMLDADGGFYSSIDADSEGEEGKYYRWDRVELSGFKSMERYEEFASLYRLDGEPNFESIHYVLAPRDNLRRLAKERGQSISQMLHPLNSISRAMLEHREKRVRPITDTKILTAWNGLAIAGLADAGRVLGQKRYLKAAVACLEFVMQNSRDPEGRLMRSHAMGNARFQGYLDDYAFVISGILSLHRATKDERLLVMAAELMEQQIQWFWDGDAGGFFFTASDHPESIVRLKNPVDGAVPSGISVSAENLSYLIQHGVKRDDKQENLSYESILDLTMRSVLPLLKRAPAASTRMSSVAVELLFKQRGQ